MTSFNILLASTPVGHTALAKIGSTVSGIATDMTSVRCVWKDHLGVTIVDMTRTTVDINTTGIHGEAATLTDPAGTGNYESTLVIHTATYQGISLPANFSLTITIADANGSRSETFVFRVSSSSLDISLESTSVITAVRRQAGLLKDVTHVAEGNENTRQGNLISLGDEIVYGIEAAYKNGASFAVGTTGDTYAWVTYRPNVKLNTTPTANDFFFFTVKTGLGDVAVEEYILSARRIVVSALGPHYDDAALDTYPTVLGIIQDLCVGQIRELSSRGVALESAHYRSGRDLKLQAMDRLRRIQKGLDAVADSDGTIIERRSGSLVGGFRSAFGPIGKRGDWWERLREYQGTIMIPVGQEETT